MKSTLSKIAILLAVAVASTAGFAQAPPDRADAAMVNRIWDEATNRSSVMHYVSYLCDVVGPRIQGSPAMKRAQQWAERTFEEMGLQNAAIEPCGEFGLGWSNDYVSVHMLQPTYQPILAYAKPWTAGTKGRIQGTPVLVEIKTRTQMQEQKGKLKGAIVLTEKPRATQPAFKPMARRYTDQDLAELAGTPIPVRPPVRPGESGDLKWEELEDFFRNEGVGVIVESSPSDRSDFGAVRVDSYGGVGKDHVMPDRPPRIVVAAEHYARICRILEMKVPVTLSVEVRNTIYDQDPQGYNVVAEIPGTDRNDELVMLGGHLDSWTGGTGAVDNAAGCAVVMEAMRILKTLGVRPRRTIRAALWTGEEEGFYGSRGYVARHFGDTDEKTLQKPRWELLDREWRNPLGQSKKLLAMPDYDKISGYFNYDNGSGRIRGIYLQENFQVRPIFEEWMKPLHDLGVRAIALRNTEGTDHLPFDWIGIPGFQFIQDPLDYFPQLHHTNQDIYDHCVPEDLVQSAVVMASFVYHTAMRPEMLPRKPLPLPIERH